MNTVPYEPKPLAQAYEVPYAVTKTGKVVVWAHSAEEAERRIRNGEFARGPEQPEHYEVRGPAVLAAATETGE